VTLSSQQRETRSDIAKWNETIKGLNGEIRDTETKSRLRGDKEH